MKTFKQISERVKASDQTKSRLQKTLNKKEAAAIKLKVKNMIGDLDGLAWKLENQIKDDKSNGSMVFSIVKEIDMLIVDVKKMDKNLKSTLNKLLK